MPEHHARRRERLREAMAGAGHEALLVTNLVDVRWLTGFTGSYGQVLITAADVAIGTDDRYAIAVRGQCPDVEAVIGREVHRPLLERAARAGATRVHVDEAQVTVAGLRALTTAVEGVEILPAALPLPALRIVKDEVEIDALREACRISDAALADIVGQPIVGRTEREIAVALERRMVDLGAQGPAFRSIVAAGEHSAIPHHEPTDRPVARGDLLKIDFGALVDGYHADETRTFVIGPPAPWQVEIHAVVQAAQAAGVAALAPGAALADIDAAARTVVADAGFGEYFTHGLGHGVGLVIHEEPFFARTATGILAAGTPVTVEPGVYLPGRGGVRIEDTVLVGAQGAVSLTETSRDLVVLG